MRRILTILCIAITLGAAPRAAEPPAFYVAAIDDRPGGLPGDVQLADLEGVPRWVSPQPFLTPKSVAEAHVRVNEPTGVLEVALELTPEGSRALKTYTGTHAGSRIGFVLDGRVLSAPVVVNRLTTETIGIYDRTFDATLAEHIAARIRELIARERGAKVA